MPGYQIPNEENRILEELRQLRAAVQDLQSKPLKIPTRQADPPAGDPNNLWFLDDGRLRGRTRDGTVVEYARSNHTHPGVTGATTGGGTSTAAPPPPAYVPSSQSILVGADWAQSYRLGGSAQRAADGWMYYGWVSPVHQEQMSMLHFPGVTALLAPNSGGPTARIDEVWLHLINQHTYPNSGTELRLGLHNSGSAPSSFAESEWPPFKVRVAKAGYSGSGNVDAWYQLPNWVGERFRDNAAQGFTLHQGTTSTAYYGYAKTFGELRIGFVK